MGYSYRLEGDQSEHAELAKKIHHIRDELSTLSKSSTSEFSPTNLHLPHFDRDDMDLLLGDLTGDEKTEGGGPLQIGQNKSPEDALKWIAESNRNFQPRVNDLLNDGEDVLRQCEEAVKEQKHTDSATQGKGCHQIYVRDLSGRVSTAHPHTSSTQLCL